MTSFQYEGLKVDCQFDPDGDLEVVVENGEYDAYRFLPREEVIRLRDHLNTVLGVAQ